VGLFLFAENNMKCGGKKKGKGGYGKGKKK
jgi:hypothetical protein